MRRRLAIRIRDSIRERAIGIGIVVSEQRRKGESRNQSDDQPGEEPGSREGASHVSVDSNEKRLGYDHAPVTRPRARTS